MHQPPVDLDNPMVGMSWQGLAILAAAIIDASVIDFFISRYLLEGSRPEMVVAWLCCGALPIWFALLFGLIHLFTHIAEINS